MTIHTEIFSSRYSVIQPTTASGSQVWPAPLLTSLFLLELAVGPYPLRLLRDQPGRSSDSPGTQGTDPSTEEVTSGDTWLSCGTYNIWLYPLLPHPHGSPKPGFISLGRNFHLFMLSFSIPQSPSHNQPESSPQGTACSFPLGREEGK